MLFGTYLIETALWVFATLVITIWATRVYLHGAFALKLGKLKKTSGEDVNEEKQSTQTPFVTIMLPTYNEYHVVDRILGAVTAMDYPRYEVIVADDSTDKSTMPRLIEWEKQGKIKLVHRDSRAGFKAGALNNAIKIANQQSEYVLVFDADYVPPPDTIWRMLRTFSNRQADVVQGYTEHSLNASKNILTRSVSISFTYYCLTDIATRNRLNGFVPIFGSAFMIKKGVLEKLGGYNETSVTEDWELASRLIENGYKIVFDENLRIPAECPSTFKGLVKQQMRWSQGITRDSKNNIIKILKSKKTNPLKKFDYMFYGFSSFNSMFGLLAYSLSALIFFINQRLLTVPVIDRGLILGLGAFGQFALFVAPVYLPLSFIFAAVIGLYRSGKLAELPWCFSSLAINFMLSPFIAIGSIKGMLFKKGSWARTPKTGEVT